MRKLGSDLEMQSECKGYQKTEYLPRGEIQQQGKQID